MMTRDVPRHKDIQRPNARARADTAEVPRSGNRCNVVGSRQDPALDHGRRRS